MPWTVIGISGVTNSGKTSLAKGLVKAFPGSLYLCQDTYFHSIEWPHHIYVKEVNHFNWDVMSALDMDKMVEDVHKIIDREPSESESGLLILDGFLLLNHDHLRLLCSLKIYIDEDYDVVRGRRSKRTYDPPDPPGYFEVVVWPESRNSRKQMLEKNKDLILLSGSGPLANNIKQIMLRLESFNFKRFNRDDCNN